jgi:DNA-binding beta-propeller fold protein YncE
MKSTLRFLLVCLLLVAASAPAVAQHVITTIHVGYDPASVVVNPKTNRIYVGNIGVQSVSIIDGVTNVIKKTLFVQGVDNLGRPLLIYPPTNKIFAGDPDTNAEAIDGKTNAVTVLEVGFSWLSGSVELGTSNWLYILSGSQVSVVDANDLGVAAIIPLANTEYANYVAANPNSGRVYVASSDSGDSTWSIKVIDTSTNTIIDTFPLGAVNIWGISIDAVSNRLYVATSPLGSLVSSLSALDGTTGALLGSTQPVGQIISLLAMPEGGKVLVGGGRTIKRRYPDSLIFINGDTLAVTRVIEVGAVPASIAYNPVTKRIYVANSVDNTVSVVGN